VSTQSTHGEYSGYRQVYKVGRSMFETDRIPPHWLQPGTVVLTAIRPYQPLRPPAGTPIRAHARSSRSGMHERARVHTRTHTRTHARTHTRTHTHAHTQTHTHTRSAPSPRRRPPPPPAPVPSPHTRARSNAFGRLAVAANELVNELWVPTSFNVGTFQVIPLRSATDTMQRATDTMQRTTDALQGSAVVRCDEWSERRLRVICCVVCRVACCPL
jgi:hypothetical protein